MPDARPHGLRETQEWLAASVLDPARLDAAADAGVLVPPPLGDIARRLHAYADGYPARIRESLMETFPAVTHVLGEQQTTALTQRYLAAHPPRSNNLNHVGHLLPQFLRTDSASRDLPFLPDLAELELLVARSFHAQQLPVLDPATLADWTDDDWSTARLRFQPAVAVLTSPWPLRDLHAARETPRDQIDIDLCDRPDHVLVRRHELFVYVDPIDETESRALRALLDGNTLGNVMQELGDSNHDPSAVGAWFARWMQLGLIIAVDRSALGERPV